MGCAPSTQRPSSAARSDASRGEKLPAVNKNPGTSKMVRADLERSMDNKKDCVMAPTKLPALEMQLASRNARFDLMTPDMDNVLTKVSAPSLPSVTPNMPKGYPVQTSLSTSTQRQYGLSDNTSPPSSIASDDEWNPPEFGPLVESLCLASARRCVDADDSFLGDSDDSDDVGFYLHFLQLNGATSVAAQRSISAMELLGKTSSSENARTRFLMGGTAGPAEGPNRSPATTPGAGDEKASRRRQQRSSRYAAAKELGPVDADRYVDALYLRSRERERTHFFIDADGEICRLYHTEGWHVLCSTKRSHNLHRQRSRSGCDSGSGSIRRHRPRQSSSSTITKQAPCSPSAYAAAARPATGDSSNHEPHHPVNSGVGHSATTSLSPMANPTDYGVSSPAEKLGGAAPLLRNTRFGSSGMLNGISVSPYTPTPPQGKRTDGASTAAAAARGYPQDRGSPVPEKNSPPLPSSSRHGDAVGSTESRPTASGDSLYLGSGRASTLPGSRGEADFFSQAFGSGATAAIAGNTKKNNMDTELSGMTPPSQAQPRISPILVKPDGNYPGCTSRRGSFNSTRQDGEGSGEKPESASLRRRLSTRRVSFSQGTRYFKKDPFYITPRSEKESEYTDLTPPEENLRIPLQPPTLEVSVAAAEVPPAVLVPKKPDSSASYAQLTLLKDKMTQNRERNMSVPM
jgi:hypothetical protein